MAKPGLSKFHANFQLVLEVSGFPLPVHSEIVPALAPPPPPWSCTLPPPPPLAGAPLQNRPPKFVS